MSEEKNGYKLPYIPDRDLYAAVMFACKMIRENGYFNKDVNRAAKYYGVDPDDVARYVRIAQGNGQRKANEKNPPRKYYYFVVEYCPIYGEGGFYQDWAKYTVIKATSQRNAQNRVSERYDRGDYVVTYFGRVEPFNTEDEAIQCAQQWKADLEARLKAEEAKRLEYDRKLVEFYNQNPEQEKKLEGLEKMDLDFARANVERERKKQ